MSHYYVIVVLRICRIDDANTNWYSILFKAFDRIDAMVNILEFFIKNDPIFQRRCYSNFTRVRSSAFYWTTYQSLSRFIYRHPKGTVSFGITSYYVISKTGLRNIYTYLYFIEINLRHLPPMHQMMTHLLMIIQMVKMIRKILFRLVEALQ